MLHLNYFKSAILQQFSNPPSSSGFKKRCTSAFSKSAMHLAAVSKFRHLAGDFTKPMVSIRIWI
jgi:hypothetical protein